MGAEKFNLVPKFPPPPNVRFSAPNVVFLEEIFRTGRKFTAG